MDRTYSEDGFKYIPWIFFQLFVTKAQTTIFFVDIEYLNFYRSTDLSHFTRMFDLLCPGKVGDMDQSFYAIFNFDKGAEVGEVTYGSGVRAAHRIFLFNIFPWIGFELFDAERHFTFITIECQDNGFHLFVYRHKVLCTVQMLCPAHFRNMD